MPRKQDLKKTPLLPLEYCTIGRASRLLGCETEDILHWSELGAIKIFIKINMETAHYCKALNFGDLSYNRILRYAYFSRRLPICSNGMYADEIFPRENINIPHTKSPFRLHGLWNIAPADVTKYIRSFLLNEPLSDPIRVIADIDPAQEPNNSVPNGYITLINPVTTPEPWVILDDIKFLQRHINSGERLPIKNGYFYISDISDEQTSQTGVYETNTKIEEFASIREQVLVAAIYAKHKWPDECKSATAWADALYQHSNELFGGDKTPLSQDTMSRMLSSAEGKNAVYKRTN